MSDLLNLDMDSQPTIRPVVDLSDVADSANTINGMFSMSPSVGVLSDMQGISSMINNIQNGNDNSDLISALVESELKIGKDRDWSFYPIELSDCISNICNDIHCEAI